MNKFFGNQLGVTLIEVMVTIAILSVGLLGVAGLQITSMRYNTNAHNHTIAAQQARDMADRMRANISSVLNGDYNVLGGFPTQVKDCTQLAVVCTPLELKDLDLFQWNSANKNLLVDGQGTVQANAEGNVFIITITWSDHGVAKSYALEVQP